MSIHEGLTRLMESGEQLPTLPTAVFQLNAALANDNATAGDVAAVIERDPALTARLLRAANSAAMSRGAQVGSVTMAVQRLGLNQVRALTIALAVVQAFGGRERGLPHDLFWTHSGTVGVFTRKLWLRHGAPGADDAYVGGLLHDVGLLVLDQFFPKEFDTVADARAELDIPLWQHEEDYLGIDHGHIGGLLLGHWGLPKPVVEAVANHHAPDPAAGALPMARAVFAAEALCTELGFGLPIEGRSSVAADDALASMGITGDDAARLRDELWELAQESSGFLV